MREISSRLNRDKYRKLLLFIYFFSIATLFVCFLNNGNNNNEEITILNASRRKDVITVEQATNNFINRKQFFNCTELTINVTGKK